MKSVGIELPDGKNIKLLQEGESYKYLGILDADKFLEEKMKLNVSKECIRRLSYCKAACCGSISTVISSIALLCVSSIMLIIIIVITTTATTTIMVIIIMIMVQTF